MVCRGDTHCARYIIGPDVGEQEEEDDVPIPEVIHALPPLKSPLDAESGRRPHADRHIKAKPRLHEAGN